MMKAVQGSKGETIKKSTAIEITAMADTEMKPAQVTSDEDVDQENKTDAAAASSSKTQPNGTAAKPSTKDDGISDVVDEVRSDGNVDSAAKDPGAGEDQFDEQQKNAAAALKQQAQNEAEAAKYLAAARMANNPLHMMAQGARMGLTGAVPPMVWPPNAAAAAAYGQAGFAANHNSPASASAAAGIAAAAAAAQSSQTSGPQTLLYTVGFGIDPRQSVSNGWDATEAAVRALRDAMERSTVRLPPSGQGNPFQIHVKIGVPPRQDIISRLEPMNVDMSRITSILPRSIPVMPIDIVVGGLSVSGHDDPDVSICSAVACVTVQTNATANPVKQHERHAWERASVAANAAGVHPMMNQMPHTPMEGSAAWSSNLERKQQQQQPKPPPQAAERRKSYNRVDSMEMLARISEQVRERPGILGGRLHPQDSPAEAAMPTQGIYDDPQKQQTSTGSNKDDDDESSNTDDKDNYKKLPPGVTAKNNKRQFVQHNYHDHSLELPTGMEENPMYGAVTKTGKSAGSQPSFPVKLHELLGEIEADGYGFILSWLPHGRSFKIHKQQEFLDVVLPQYFVMTKKSSFLRQLNLYGFNRFSAGPDKGSYYHELFLRGMPWLSKRMTRMKVNGNGIRAAGNPDMEPDFYIMPPVPREELATAGHREIYVRKYTMDDQQQPSNPAQPQQPQEEANPPSPLPEIQSQQKDLSSISPKILNGTTQISFPLKLQTMLDKLEAEGNTDAISWLPHGRGFLVHKPDIFVNDLMPAYFRQTKYSSFQRQLHMYSFQRITAGRDKGAYYHEHFLRGKPRLCQKMVRTRINGKGCRKPGNPSNEPDFYSMKKMAIIPEGTNIEIPKELISSPVGPDDDDGSSS